MAYEMVCQACGQTFRNDDREQLFREVEQHNRQQHSTPTSRDEFEQRVQETPARS